MTTIQIHSYTKYTQRTHQNKAHKTYGQIDTAMEVYWRPDIDPPWASEFCRIVTMVRKTDQIFVVPKPCCKIMLMMTNP